MAKASTSIFRITSFAVPTSFIGIALAVLVLTTSASADAFFELGNTVGPITTSTLSFPVAGQEADIDQLLVGYVTRLQPAGRLNIAFTSSSNVIRAASLGSTVDSPGGTPSEPTKIMNMQIAPCFNLGHPLANCFSFTTLRFEVATTPSRREPFVMVAFVCTPGPDADSPCTNSHGVLQSAAANQTTWTIKTRDNEVVWDVEISSAIGFEELKNVVFSTGPGTFRELDGGIEDEEGMNVGPGDGGSGFKPDIDQEPIPEPSSMLLLGSGVLGLAQVLRRKRS